MEDRLILYAWSLLTATPHQLIPTYVPTGLIKQFLTDVDWGELDFLVIDST